MLERGGNIDLLGALGHPVEDHVYQDVRPRPPHSITAVHHHRATPASVALVNFPTETENSIKDRSAPPRSYKMFHHRLPGRGLWGLNYVVVDVDVCWRLLVEVTGYFVRQGGRWRCWRLGVRGEGTDSGWCSV